MKGLDFAEFLYIPRFKLDGSTYYLLKNFMMEVMDILHSRAGDCFTNKYKGLARIEVYFSNEYVTMYIDNIKITDRPKAIILNTDVYNYFRTTDDEKTIDVTGLACIGYSDGRFFHTPYRDEVGYTVYEGYGTEGSEIAGR